MTHDDLMISIRKTKNATIGDYISLAVADDWTKEQTVSNLYQMYLTATGENLWDEIAKLYDRYILEFGIGAVDQERKTGPVEYQGKVYTTAADAARENKVAVNTIRYALKKGRATYV